MKRDELYELALDTYGYNAQEDMLLEEMSELQKVILKGRREALRFDDLADEIADVEIMLEQIKKYHGISKNVSKRKEYKKLRLQRRLH